MSCQQIPEATAGQVTLGRALRVIGVTLGALAALVGVEAARPLVDSHAVAQAAQPIQGTFYDIEGNGAIGKWVSANQGGEQDSTQSTPSYQLFQDPTSGVPADPGPQLRIVSWGAIKAGYATNKSRSPGHGAVIPGRTLAGVREALVGDSVLAFNGGDTHWSVTHDFGTLTEPLTFNIAVPPKVWTNAPYFVNIPVVAGDVQTALGVKPPGFRDENDSWPMSGIPVLIDGDFDTQADLDSLDARIAHFTAMTGRVLFRYAPGEIDPPNTGMWWQHDSFQNSTNLYPDESNPIEGTVCAGLMQTTTSGYRSRTTSEHEMVRALGVLGNANNPLAGITNADPSFFKPYDAMIIEWIMRDRERTESGQNSARLSEMR